jgi:hypothetical protein
MLVLLVRDDDPRARILQPMLDAVVPVEQRHGEQQRPELPGAKEDRRGLRCRRQHDGDAVAAFHPRLLQRVRGLARQVLELAPRDLADGAREVLVDHRELVTRMLVADLRGDVEPLRDVPLVLGDGLLVAGG